MRISFTKFPISLFVCFLWSIIILPITLYPMDTAIRTVFGLPFLIFIPGYILVFALFPTKKIVQGIDTTERIALSFGLSIAIVPLIGFLLNYTPGGIGLQSILLSLLVFNIIVSFIAFYRWNKAPSQNRIIFSFEFSYFKTKNKFEMILIIFLVLSIIITFSTIIYVINNPRTGETFTEFYLLGSKGEIVGYPRNLSIGEDGSVIIGLVNHEYKTINYTIEIWLIEETYSYNTTTHTNETTYTHMWFMDKFTQSLKSISFTNDKDWKSQWEYNYTFQIKRRGEYKLTFLLFTTPAQEYNRYEDYKNIAEQWMKNAYQRTYLNINVV